MMGILFLSFLSLTSAATYWSMKNSLISYTCTAGASCNTTEFKARPLFTSTMDLLMIYHRNVPEVITINDSKFTIAKRNLGITVIQNYDSTTGKQMKFLHVESTGASRYWKIYNNYRPDFLTVFMGCYYSTTTCRSSTTSSTATIVEMFIHILLYCLQLMNDLYLN